MEELVLKSEKGNPVTTSLLVAQKFGKRHVEVLDAIRDLMVLDAIRNLMKVENSTFVDNQNIANLSTTLSKMFYFSTQKIKMPVGEGFKDSPIVIMTRDGFSLLVMGFTGEKALKFKLDFIEAFNRMESELKSQLPDFNNPAIAARAWADEFEKRTLSENKVKELAPKAVVYDNIANADNITPLADIAKTLGYGRNALMNEMRERKILRKNNTPYQEYIDRGYFVVKVNPIIKGGKEITNYTQTFVTGKGIVWLSKEFEK